MRKGFTLIELLIVVAVIGLFIAIMAVAISDTKNTEKRKENPQQYCQERAKDLTVKDLPAMCLKYFQE